MLNLELKEEKSVKAKKRKRRQKQYSKSHSNMRHQKKVPNLKHIQVWHAPKTENRF